MAYDQVKIREDVHLAVVQHLSAMQSPPQKQDFISDLIELALRIKRIPLVNPTKGVTR